MLAGARIFVLALALAFQGCAGARQGNAVSAGPEPGALSGSTVPADPGAAQKGPFPSPDELDQLGEAPLPASLFALDVAAVERWKLAGPFPQQVGALPSTAGDPWEELLAESVRRRAGLVLATQGMRCVAREMGRFYLAHRARPTGSLENFILTRCHVSVASVGMGWVANDVPEARTETDVFGYWEEGVRATLERSLTGGPRAAGIWFGRQDGHAVVMVATGTRRVHVEPFSPFVGPDGRIEIRGEVLVPSSGVTALLNRGRFGYARCADVGDTRAPGFHLACQVDRSDAATVVGISLHPPNRLLGAHGLFARVWTGEQTQDEYRRPEYGKPSPVAAPEEVPDAFAERLNRVRREAGLEPLALDRGQSETASELAPHFFSAVLGNQGRTADLVVLGMMAGWTVDGLVQSGHFASAWVSRSTDVTELLSTALEYPSGRETLLAGEVERLAVGPVLEGKQGEETIAAVFGTYALFSQEAHSGLVEQVYARLDAERARRGSGPVERLDEVAPFCHRAASQVQAGKQPADAMSALLHNSSGLLRRAVAGWIVETGDLESIEFPKEYLEDRSLGVAAAVGYRRAEGEPWGRYVVLLVVAEPDTRGA